MRRCGSTTKDGGRCTHEVGPRTVMCAAGHTVDHTDGAVAATPFRGRARQAATIDPMADPYFTSDEWDAFHRTVHAAASRHGVDVTNMGTAAGLWEGEGEPSELFNVHGHPDNILAFADEVATLHNQDAALVAIPNDGGTGLVAEYQIPQGTHPQQVIDVLQHAGVPGATLTSGGRLLLVDPDAGTSREFQRARRAIAMSFQETGVRRADIAFVSSRDDTDARATRRDGSSFPGYARGAAPGEGTTWGSTPAAVQQGLQRVHGNDVVFADHGIDSTGLRHVAIDTPTPEAWEDAADEVIKQGWSALRGRHRS